MVQTIRCWNEVLAQVKSDYPHISPRIHKYKLIIAKLAEEADLSSNQTTQLALHIGLKWYPRPKNVPESWKLLICKDHLSQKYLNPLDLREYVSIKLPKALGGLPYILHRTSQGYADAQWFYEMVPELEMLLKDPTISHPFSELFNLTVNRLFENRRNGLGMTVGQLQAINLFFEKHVPGLDGICTTCFKISLPKSGAGERFVHRQNDFYEVRLSAAKPNARFPNQRIEYVTHREVDLASEISNPTAIYSTWNKKKKSMGFDKNVQQEDSHIPWNIYDFKKFEIGMPICKCMKKF